MSFTEATDSVDAANSVKGLCGDRNYRVVDANTGSINAISWISITKDDPSIDTHKITFTPLDQSLVTGSAHAYFLETKYAEYASHAGKYTALSVQVTTANCNCDLLGWDNPSATS